MENRKRTEEFAKKFLNEPRSSYNNKIQKYSTVASSSQQRGPSAMTYSNLSRSHVQSRLADEYNMEQHQQDNSALTYDTTGQSHNQQNARGYDIDDERLYLSNAGAGGDANIEGLNAKCVNNGKHVCAKSSQTRFERSRNPNETYSQLSASSSRSDTSHKTAIEQRGKRTELIKLTHSKANLLKAVDEGMLKLHPEQCGCNNKMLSAGRNRSIPKETFPSVSEESNACSSPSAGLINEKIIHPMVKKFRLLYLHNIKEEVSIMEDLEILPHKLDEICRKMERDY